MMEAQHVETENVSNLKRKRETSVLDNFTKLTNAQEKVRVKAGVELLKHLSEDKTAEKAEDELKYALGRLVRGLGGSKLPAKTGFFAALVGLLNLGDVAVGAVLDHVAKELHKGGGNSKSENADVCSGQILVAGAIIRSNLYHRCDDEEKGKILELLLNAGKERTYLNLASYKFLIDLFEKIDSKEFERVVFPLIKNDIGKAWSEQNLDTLYLLLDIEKRFSESLHKKFLKNTLGTSEILCEESLRDVCNTLMVIPRLLALRHPIFALIPPQLAEMNLSEPFFAHLDSALARSNRNKYLAFTKLLTQTIQTTSDPTIIPNILTNNYIQQTISTYKTAVGKNKDKEFKEATQQLFEAILNAMKGDTVKTKTKIKVLKRLLFNPGTFIFEKVTKSRLVQNITGTLNIDGVKKLGGIYREVVLGEFDKGGEAWWNADRVYAAHLLVKLVNNPVMQDDDWKVEQLLFLGKLGIFTGEIGNELAESLKDAFYSSLDIKLTKLDNLRGILSKIFHEFDEAITNDPSSLRSPLEDKDQETWKKTVKLVTKLDGSSKKKGAVFHTLFLNLGLQIFNSSKMASDSLTELFSCYERTKKKDESSDDPLWIEVVVDLFLNLLSHNSHLLRRVINCVFPHLCKYLNGTAIHQILAVLDPKNEGNPLSQPGESDDEEEDEDDEDEDEEEESDGGDDEEEEENVSDKLRMALHQILGADVDSDAESVDLDTLDDEHGEKLNEALGQTFKQFKPNLGKNKKQKKDDEALTHFRIRVLDLVEIYLSSNPSLILTLEIMLPLLQLLEFCIKNEHQKPLQDRVRSVLKKLTSLKKFSEVEDVTEDVLVDLLKSLLEKGTRNAVVIQEMAEKISEGAIFAITCSQSTEKVTRVVTESLEVFFTRRDCVIPYVFFKSLVQLNWEGIIPLVPLLTGFVFASKVRPFRRNQAMELLVLFCHNQRFISGHSEHLQDTLVNFLKDCVDFFREFNTDPGQKRVKEKFLTNLFELLQSVRTSVLAKGFESWDILGDVVRECRSQLTFSRDTKLAYNKLCKSLNISNVVQMKQKTVKLNNVNEDDEPVEKKKKKKENGSENQNGVNNKKKRNKNKEALKLKKQSKELRLESLSGGFNGKRKFELEEDESKRAKL